MSEDEKYRYHTLKVMALPLGLMGVIFVLSSVPGQLDEQRLRFLTDIDPQLQNLMHIPLFGLLQVLWLRAFAKLGKYGWKSTVSCLAISLGYGCLDEFHQMFVPGRYASLLDITLNFTGIVLGTLMFLVWDKVEAKP